MTTSAVLIVVAYRQKEMDNNDSGISVPTKDLQMSLSEFLLDDQSNQKHA